MKKNLFFLFIVMTFSFPVFAQDLEMTLDREFEEIEPPKEKPAEIVIEKAVEPPKPAVVDDNRVTPKKEIPLSQPIRATKPTAKIQSGTVNVGGGEKTIKVQHPNAAKGLIKIKKDGTYQYKVKLREKSQSTTIGLATFTSPKITNSKANTPITFSSMYGGSPMAFVASYEWMPFRGYGALGLYLESGFSVSRGRGQLADGGVAEESYSLYIIPVTAFLKYRFEYMRRQWVVPYIMGGGTYYGLVEARDDGQQTQAASSAVGGGGGFHINLSRMDPEGAYRLDREWGIADMWLTFEMRVMQGLKPQIDFTNATVQAGITLDY